MAPGPEGARNSARMVNQWLTAGERANTAN